MKLQEIYRQQWVEAYPRMQSADTDQWYVDFTNRLLPAFEKSEPTGQMIRKNQAVLYFAWYLEDCMSNSGSWSAFIRSHKQLYGRFLPFYTLTESYADDEINPGDVSLLLWTLLSLVIDSFPSPWDSFDSSLSQLAPDVYVVLDAHFEQAPLTGDEPTEWFPDVHALLPPSGPILDVLSEMSLPRDVANFLSASGEEQVVYLKDYVDLRRFCADALKWADEGDSLMPELANEGDFVFFTNPKGVLLAPNIVVYFRDERNPEYNPGITEQEGAELFYIPRLCPIDLLHYAIRYGLLPKVVFPFGGDRGLLHKNRDFIAHKYLGKYYNEGFYEEERK